MRSLSSWARAGAASFLIALASTPGATAQVERAELDTSAFALGTLSPADGALSSSLWQGSDRDTVAALLRAVPTSFVEPLHLDLLRRITLSPGNGPAGSDNALAGLKFFTAAKAGFHADAASLAALVPQLDSEPMLAKVVAYADLMEGRTENACAQGAGLQEGRTDEYWIKLRYICYVRSGEGSAASLTLDLLRRQDMVTPAQVDAFRGFAAGISPNLETAPLDDVFTWAMAREGGLKLDAASVDMLTPGMVAALARDESQSAPARETALIAALAAGTVGEEEARRILETLPTATLSRDLVAVAASPAGSQGHYEAIAAALAGAGGDYRAFTARALLLRDALEAARPGDTYPTAGGLVALAAMSTGQTRVAERWMGALASTSQNAESGQSELSTLLTLYAALEPSAAQRLSGSFGLALGDRPSAGLGAEGTTGQMTVAQFVGASLDAAQAGSQGPAALVYLMGANVSTAGEGEAVRETVLGWAREAGQLTWLERRAAFRGAAQSYLADNPGGVAARLRGGIPVPRVKPQR